MKKLYYEKKGRRYVPVSEYDSTFMDAFPKGSHLVSVYPGGSSRRFNIDPAYAPMIAAARVAEDAITRAMHQASEAKPKERPITPRQRKAWEALAKAFGNDRYYVELPSAREIAEEGVRAMQLEADKLLDNPAVKKAWDYFMMVCALTKEQEKSQ